MKTVELKDEWERFSIRFSIFCPSAVDPTSTDFMRVIGSVPELTKSGTIGSGPLKMRKARKKFRWMFDKFGQEMMPWECLLKFKINQFESLKEIIYSYSKTGANSNEHVYEREPSRTMEIQ